MYIVNYWPFKFSMGSSQPTIFIGGWDMHTGEPLMFEKTLRGIRPVPGTIKVHDIKN